MNTEAGLEHCLSFINCQLQSPRGVLGFHNGNHRRAITISRQTGSGGHAIAERLAALLQARRPGTGAPWTVFDMNLVERVLEEHHLPQRLARFMPEDRTSEIADTMDELFGLHPPSWTLVRKTAETILRLAEMGNVIILGRGSNIITAKLEHMFHVRLVGSLERRIRHVQEVNQLSPGEAQAFVHSHDLGRSRFVRKYFNREIEDPLLYHMVINTDLVSFEEAAELIADRVVSNVRAHQGIGAMAA